MQRQLDFTSSFEQSLNDAQRRSIDVLHRCLNLHSDAETRAADIRPQRLDTLLAEFAEADGSDNAFAIGWHFAVRPSFHAALDIGQTPRTVNGKQYMQWTQGSWFHFEAGDTVYDSPKAYDSWNLNNFDVCLDIRRAAPARPASKTEARYAGAVICDILVPNEERKKLVPRETKAFTQDEFVEFLILGRSGG